MNLQLNESVNLQFGLGWKTLIPSNLYGFKEKLGRIDDSAHVLESLIARTLYAKRNHKASVEVWGDGTPLRTFLHVKDLASATFHLMGAADQLPSIININGGEEFSIKKLAESIVYFAGYKGDLWFNSTKPNGASRKNLDDSILRSTGWSPETQFLSELKDLILKVEAGL
jgi:GDP-L-fucose synthase